MVSNAVTTSGSSNTSSNQDLTIDVDCNEIDNDYTIVPNHTRSEVNRYRNRTTSEAPTLRGDDPSGIRLCLQEEELWQEFHAVGNEMIVTKPGRRMYPYLVITPYELKAGVQYVVLLRIVPVDNKRYKYTNGVWHSVGGSEPTVDSTRMSFKHPTTPALGEHLNGKPLIFKHAKLTHIRENKEHILVRTMHKYMAIIQFSEVPETTEPTSFYFVETTFIAVTSYLSSQLTSLKIRHNPFARGIQDRAQLSITNGDSDYTDEDDDILPPILSGNPPSSLLTSNVAMPFFPLVPLPPQPQQSSSTSSSFVPPPPTLSVPQIFSYTSASSYSQPSSCISTPSQPQDSSCISASNYISTFPLSHHIPTPPFPFCVPATSHPQDSSGASGSGLSQNTSFIPRLPQWSSYLAPNTSLMPITNYITTPSGRRHFYSQVSWPYPYPSIPHRAFHRLPSTESFKMMPSFHPYIPHPSSAAQYYPTTTIHYPVYYNPNYRPNMQ